MLDAADAADVVQVPDGLDGLDGLDMVNGSVRRLACRRAQANASQAQSMLSGGIPSFPRKWNPGRSHPCRRASMPTLDARPRGSDAFLAT